MWFRWDEIFDHRSATEARESSFALDRVLHVRTEVRMECVVGVLAWRGWCMGLYQRERVCAI